MINVLSKYIQIIQIYFKNSLKYFQTIKIEIKYNIIINKYKCIYAYTHIFCINLKHLPTLIISYLPPKD